MVNIEDTLRYWPIGELLTLCSRIEGDDISGEGAGRLSAYVSFGGLLMRLQVGVQLINTYYSLAVRNATRDWPHPILRIFDSIAKLISLMRSSVPSTSSVKMVNKDNFVYQKIFFHKCAV